MKKPIYYGNVTSHIMTQPVDRPLSEVTRNTIVFTGFDLSELAASLDNKLDLLFYNRVNEIGEVLSSLVYISNPLELDDVDEKVYDVKKLYTNTDAERAMKLSYTKKDFTYLNCKWATSKFFTSSISPMTDVAYVDLSPNGNPSPKLEKYGISFDGWYTQMSVGVRELSIISPMSLPIVRDVIGFHAFTDIGTKLAILLSDNPVNLYNDLNWSPYTIALENGTTNPDDTVLYNGTSLANVLVTLSEDNPYIKQDLFILPTYIALYDSAVVQYAEYPTYGNPYPVLRDKHRIIHNYADDNNFLEAQYVLQSTEYFRAVTHS